MAHHWWVKMAHTNILECHCWSFNRKSIYGTAHQFRYRQSTYWENHNHQNSNFPFRRRQAILNKNDVINLDVCMWQKIFRNRSNSKTTSYSFQRELHPCHWTGALTGHVGFELKAPYLTAIRYSLPSYIDVLTTAHSK